MLNSTMITDMGVISGFDVSMLDDLVSFASVVEHLARYRYWCDTSL